MSERIPSSAPANETEQEKLKRLFPNSDGLGAHTFVDSHGVVQPAKTVEEAAKLHQDENEMA